MVAVSPINMAMQARMKKELEMLANEPPHGISAWTVDDKLNELEAQIRGPEGTPYESGLFRLSIVVPERYPFEPPAVRFVTPIYHPNIDNEGRICLDTLKMQPKGSWLPSVNLSTLLTTIRLLMAEPNADDGLMPDITDLYRTSRSKFNTVAAEHTTKHAVLDAEILEKPALALPTSLAPGKTDKPVDAEDDDDDDGGEDDDEEEAGDDDEGDEEEEGGEDDEGDDDDDDDDEDFGGDDDDDDEGGDDDDDDGGDDDEEAGDDDEDEDDDEEAGDEDEEEDEEEEERPKKKSKTEEEEEEEEEEEDEEDEE